MIKLIKSHNEYHLVDTKAPIKSMEDLCYNEVAPFGRYSGLDFCMVDLSESKPFSEDKTTNLFQGIHKAIATTGYSKEFEGLIHIRKEQIEQLIGIEKCGHCGDSDNEYHRNEGDEKWLCCSCYISHNCSPFPQTLWSKGEKKEFTLSQIKSAFNSGDCYGRADYRGDNQPFKNEEEFLESLKIETTEWEAEIKIIDVKPNESSQTQFAPYKSIQIIKLSPVIY